MLFIPTHFQLTGFGSRLACALGCVLVIGLPNLLAAERPNVVIILADDQSYRDFGFMGNEIVHTPHLDRLARRSVRFPNGYVPMSVCRPSLATLLTGLYPHQHGVHFNHPPPGLRQMRTMTAEQYRATRATTDYLIRDVPTLPRILARHGYACLQTGKHWEGGFDAAGFTHGMTLGRPSTRVSPITGTRLQQNGEPVAHGNGDAGLVIGRETMQPIFDFVDQHSGKKPFFVWYAPFLPHTPHDAPAKFRELYAGKSVPDYLLPYYAEIARFDETVGALLKHLEDQNLIESTLIVLASDNGIRPDAERAERQDGRSKLSVYEDGLRTPVLLHHPKLESAEYSELVQTVDIVPTVLAAVGLSEEVTPRMQGVDLYSAAAKSQAPPERPAFGAIYPNDAFLLGQPSTHARGRWVRNGKFKLVVPGRGKSPLKLQLFDLESDPREQTNLANDVRYSAQRSALTQTLDAWWTGADDAGVTTPRKRAKP